MRKSFEAYVQRTRKGNKKKSVPPLPGEEDDYLDRDYSTNFGIVR